MGDKSKGLVGKFVVQRNDGSHEPGGKHHDCDYFVLDLTHDPHAIPALRAYADSARADGYGPLINAPGWDTLSGASRERFMEDARAALQSLVERR